MNDRYLFKAKRIDWQEWIKECQWFQGNLITIGERYYLAQCRNNSNELWIGEWVEIDTSTLCQCTGLKDRNGNLIWENDVVAYLDTYSTESGYAESDRIGKVVWDDETISFQVTNRLCAESYEVLEDCSVIGNIFDTPNCWRRSDEKQKV